MHFLEELGWDEELGRVLVPGTGTGMVARYQYAWYVPVHVLVPVQYQVVLFLYQVPGIAHSNFF